MKRFLILVIWLILGSFSLVELSRGAAPEPGALSPYFLVETAESPLENFPLKETRVEATIVGVIADVTVRQTYSNMGNEPITATYVFPGSTTAAVHGMRMTIGERVVKARINRREEARKIFEAARAQGKNSSLLEQKRANVFTMEVANILPGDAIEIKLEYTELLVPEDGTYEFVYPAVAGPRYSTLSAENAPASEHWVRNPYLREGADPRTDFAISLSIAAGMDIQEISSSSHDIDVNFVRSSQAAVTLADNSEFGGNRDFILRYRLAGQNISTGLIVQKGPDENFFLLMAQPPERVDPELLPPREYLFVIDVSGSMSGYPLDTAKSLVRDLISGLKTTDTFNVMFFAGGSEVMAESSVPATGPNISRALSMIESSRGGGGTELLKAMDRAMNLPKQEGVSRTMAVITDGYINAERELFELIQLNLHHTNVFAFGIGSSVNRYLIEGIARSGQGEPFVVTRADEAGPAATKFADYISSPVLTDIEVAFEGFDVYDVEPPSLPDLFAERPVIVFGKWRGEPAGLVTVSGKNGRGPYTRKIPVGGGVTGGSPATLSYLWARSRLSRISDFTAGRDHDRNREEIVALGLKYNLLTPFTSFVAVDEVVRNPNRDSRDVTQPLPLPENVSNLAVGAEIRSVPEPGLIMLAALLAASALLGRRRTRKPLP